MTIQDLSREIERGRRIYKDLNEVKKSSKNVTASGVNFGDAVTFWLKVESQKDAVTLANRYKKVLYNSPITKTGDCFSLTEEVDGTVYCVLILHGQDFFIKNKP